MRTSPKIGSTHLEQMNLIYEFICRFDVANLLYAINGKQLDEDEIVSLKNDISEYNLKLNRQKQYLFKFCKTFPKEFAHEDNNIVNSSVKVSWRMRSGSAGIKKILKRFCKVSYSKLPEGQPAPQAIDRSLISSKNFMLELFGLSSYPLCVKELFMVMYEFYSNMIECIEEGVRALREEKSTKADALKCLDYLTEACEKSRRNQSHIIEAMMADPEFKKALMKNKNLSGDDENPVLKAYKQSAESKEQFAQRHYHNCSPQDVAKITIYEACLESEQNPALSFAKVVFGKDETKIMRINYVIEHFDELLPKECKRGKIPALNLFFFYQWACPIVGVESFLKYFDKYYNEHGGKWGTIGKSAINGASTKHTKCRDGSTEKLNTEMLTQIEAMLNKKFPQIEQAS